MSATETLWRCRECGKWSHAKRDPIQHKRWQPAPDVATDEDGMPYRGQGWFVWCGPFDRWETRHSDPSPRPALLNLGEPVSYAEREIALGTYTPSTLGEAPF
jgi:hypothetical protein